MLERGEFCVGDKLPPESEFRSRYNCSRTTVREGLAHLVQKGILEKRRGSGTYLARTVPLIPKSKVIGAIVPSISVFGKPVVYYQIIQGIENAAHEKGYSLLIGNMDNELKKAKQLIKRFIDNNVNGIIYAPMIIPEYESRNAEVIEEIDKKGIPLVIVNSTIGQNWGGRFSFVGSDHFSAMVQIVKYLEGLGHRHIGFIRCFIGVGSSDQQHAGYLHQIRAAKLPFNDEYVQTVSFGSLTDLVQSQGCEEAKKLLSLRTPPTAIISTNDYVAKNVINQAKSMGLRLPEDLAIVGFDDDSFSPYLDPPLTTVHQPLYEEGFQAFELLFNKLKKQSQINEQKFLNCKLIIRESSGAIRSLPAT